MSRAIETDLSTASFDQTEPDPWAVEWVRRWDVQQEGYVEGRSQTFDLITRAVAHLAPDARTVLDLGCGPGSLGREMARSFPQARVVGVDADPVLLHLAKGVHGHLIRPERIDLTSPDWHEVFAADSIDVVVSATALHYLSPADLEGVVAGIGRILRPGGLFVNADTMPAGEETPRLRDFLILEREQLWDAPFAGGEDFTQWWAALRAEDRPGLADLFADRDTTFPGAAHDMTPLPTWLRYLEAAGFAEATILAQTQDKRVLGAIR